jgi:hypothetical protein
MPTSASLSTARVDVAPGGTSTVELTVRNTGAVVDEFRIDAVGPAAPWITASPSVVPLFPGASAPVVLTIAAGEVRVGIKVSSREDPAGSSVEEFTLVVAPFDGSEAELIPRMARGGRKATVELAVDNHGNRRAQHTVTAFDVDNALRIEADPPSIAVDAGRAEFGRQHITPNKTFLRGPDRTLPYQVELADGGGSTMHLDGTFVQTALLPRWLLRLLALLLLLLIALLVLWQVAFKPVIRSAAKQAATQQVDDAAAKAATQPASALGATPAGGGSKPAGGGATTTTAPGSGSSGGAPGGGAAAGGGDDGKGGTSVDKRLAVEAAPGETATAEWKPGGDKDRFSLTDVVLQNPKGDTGTLRIKRGGDVLLESALENFRDLDFHFIAPYIVQGKPLVLEVVCANAAGQSSCKAAATLSGFLAKGA